MKDQDYSKTENSGGANAIISNNVGVKLKKT